MNDWANIMGRRDRLAALLRPHMGKVGARERANDIMQALLCAEEEQRCEEGPTEVALRMLSRDLDARAAQVVAFQLGRAWEAPQPIPAENRGHHRIAEQTVPPSQILGRVGVVRAPAIRSPRRRRETMILGLWN